MVKCIYNPTKDNSITENKYYIDLYTDNELIKIINNFGEFTYYPYSYFIYIGGEK